MNNKKTTKRALVSSLLSLVLCMSMLIGSTFAWFTDTATTGVNTIQSGTLDIDIVDANDTTKSLAGQKLNFVKDNGEEINDSTILWEPGCSYIMQPFKIINKGNLDAKYKIVINGLDGNAKLLEAIDFYLSTDNQLDTASDTKLLATTDIATDKELLAEATSDAYYIIGHMQEAAGNEYQGLRLTGLSITVYATQLASEYDSYNNTYDGEATYSAVPTADVTYQDGGSQGITVNTSDGGTTVMDGIYTFKATDTLSTVSANPYEKWLCDYYISFDKDVVEGAGSIAGSYAAWENGGWYVMGVPTGGIEAGQEIALINALGGQGLGAETTWTYGAICTIVEEFQCGVVQAHEESINGTTMTVELRLTNPENTEEVIVIDSIQYTFE